ncbi:MAG TPA: hypothetical protein VME86_17710 [Acidobacteriaceae bacterium]|nr:hypothetical protein [Acidobacteriaceae bacterium]
MKAPRPLISAICLLLVAASGCAPKHVPVSVVVLIPQQEGQPPHAQTESVFAEKGGTLTFKAEEGSPQDTTIEVQFLKNNVPVQVCSEGKILKGPSPLTCHVAVGNGDYDIAVQETSEGRRHPRRPLIRAYIRPCKGCSP